MSVTVSEKGWVVIPADLRKKYNLHPGAEVSVVDYGGRPRPRPGDGQTRPAGRRHAEGAAISHSRAAHRAQERARAWPLVPQPTCSTASRSWPTSRGDWIC